MKRIVSLALVCVMLLSLAGVLCSCDIASLVSKLTSDKYTYTDLGESYELSSIGDTSETEIVIPETYKGKPVTAIGERAFYRNFFTSVVDGEELPKITSITLPDTITTIGKEAFANNTELTTLNIPDSVTSIGVGAFYDCRSLTSINIPNGITTIKEGTFYGCSGLTEITLPDTVTVIEPNAFVKCSSLKSITLPSAVDTISYGCFEGCASLESFTITENITAICDNAFANCTSLKEITIPTTVTYLGQYVFNETSEELVVNVCYDSTPPKDWDAKWYYGMTGKALNTSTVYYTNVVEPNKEIAKELQTQIDYCNERYQELYDEIGRLNIASRPAQESGNAEAYKYYRDAINACKDEQREVLNRRSELQKQLDNCPVTNQIN